MSIIDYGHYHVNRFYAILVFELVLGFLKLAFELLQRRPIKQ